MAIASRAKPASYQRKRQAGHHRQSKHYLKPYWPYLPMIGIVSFGALVNQIWNQASGSSAVAAASGTELGAAAYNTSTRVQNLLGNQSPVVVLVVILLMVAALAVFTIRHGYRFHRLLNRGEAYVVQHPWVDIAAVAIFTVGAIVVRT